MQNETDPLDAALESLRGHEWPGEPYNAQLKERLMSEFHANRSASRIRRHGIAVGALAFLVLGSVGFAAAGGVEMVQKWFVTVEIDGQTVDLENANVEVQMVDENTCEVSVDLDEANLPEGVDTNAKVHTVTVNAETMTITQQADGSFVVVPAESKEAE